jgi:hypothetical protein
MLLKSPANMSHVTFLGVVEKNPKAALDSRNEFREDALGPRV